MTSPVFRLMLAHLRRAESEIEQLRPLRRVNYELRKALRETIASRDNWKAKAAEKQRKIVVLRANMHQLRQSREMWKHRALREQEAREIEDTVLGTRPRSSSSRASTGRPTWRTSSSASSIGSRSSRSSWLPPFMSCTPPSSDPASHEIASSTAGTPTRGGG